MFKKSLIYVVCLVIGICLGEVIKHEVFPNTISTIPSGSSTETSLAVIDSSTIAPDSNIVNFIKQFNEFNTDTTCKIINISSGTCVSSYGSYSYITLKCYSTSNYSFPQNVDVFYKEKSITDERVENNQIVIVSFTRYTNEHCVEKKD